jgi:hypothetical protein
MNKFRQGWLWLTGLTALLLLPVVLFGAADVITWHHLYWNGPHLAAPAADMTMASKSTLRLILGLFTAAGLAYLARIAVAAARMVHNMQATAHSLSLHLTGLPAEEIPVPMQDSGVRFMMLAGSTPEAFTFGIAQPTIVVSSAMRNLLSAPALSAIMAHEYHHVLSQDYAIQQMFMLMNRVFPWFGITGIYRHYLTVREVKADQYATRWQKTSEYLIEAIVNTIHAARSTTPAFPGEPAWNSVWQARIDALTQPETVSLKLSLRAVWPLMLLPLAGVLMLLVTSYRVSCH